MSETNGAGGEGCRCRIIGGSREPYEPHIPSMPAWEQADDCPVHPADYCEHDGPVRLVPWVDQMPPIPPPPPHMSRSRSYATWAEVKAARYLRRHGDERKGVRRIAEVSEGVSEAEVRVSASEGLTEATVPERQRCICDGICLDHCRACNYSGRDLEECCIADPDWEPDDENLAIREATRCTAPTPDALTAETSGGCERAQVERDLMSILGYTCETQAPNSQPTTEYVTDRWMKPRRNALVDYVLTIKAHAREQMLHVSLHAAGRGPVGDSRAEPVVTDEHVTELRTVLAGLVVTSDRIQPRSATDAMAGERDGLRAELEKWDEEGWRMNKGHLYDTTSEAYAAGRNLMIDHIRHALASHPVIPSEPDAGDVEALVESLTRDEPKPLDAQFREGAEEIARAVLASDWLDAVRRKAGDDRAEQIAQAIEREAGDLPRIDVTHAARIARATR